MTPPVVLALVALAFRSLPSLRPSCALAWGDWLLDRDGDLYRSLTVPTTWGPLRFSVARLQSAEVCA